MEKDKGKKRQNRVQELNTIIKKEEFKIESVGKEIIEKNKSEDINIEKSYRRKIKKRIIEN